MQHLLMASIFPFFPRKPQFVVEGADTIARFLLLTLYLFKNVVYSLKMVLDIPYYVGCLLRFFFLNYLMTLQANVIRLRVTLFLRKVNAG